MSWLDVAPLRLETDAGGNALLAETKDDERRRRAPPSPSLHGKSEAESVPSTDKKHSAAGKRRISPEASISVKKCSPNSTNNHVRKLEFVCAGLSVAQGISYPIQKITCIAMAEKMLRSTLEKSMPVELYQQLEEQVFSQQSPITSVYLLHSFTFYQAFALCATLVLFTSIVVPLANAIKRDYLNKQEVNRLQSMIIQKLVVEFNEVNLNLSQATDLLHTRMAAVENYVARIEYNFYQDFSCIFTGLFLFMLLAWDLGLITLSLCTLIMTLTSFIHKKLSHHSAIKREKREADINAHILDVVNCKDVIRSHGQELNEQQRLAKLFSNDGVQQETRALLWATFVSEFFKVFTFSLTIPGLFMFTYVFDLTLERVFQLLIITLVMDEMMRSYIQHLNNEPHMDEYRRAKQQFCHVLGMKEQDLFPKRFQMPKLTRMKDQPRRMPMTCLTKSDEENPTEEQDTNSKPVCVGQPRIHGESSIKLTDTTFGYTLDDGTTHCAVENFSASFKVGGQYAIMGESGAGKSTVFKGLAGLLKPIHGSISLGGEAVDTTSIQWRQENIGVVSQESILFNRSLRENLTYGFDDNLAGCVPDDDDLLDALDKVNMKQIVLDQLPNGLDTMICSNGGEFSGGQRQRLQICRLLLRNRPLVLLDEFTSALDAATTNNIINVLHDFLLEGGRKKTLIMITHDVQTLKIAHHLLNMTIGGGYDIQALSNEYLGTEKMGIPPAVIQV